MNIRNIKIERINKYFSISIILLPFLYQYRGFGEIISLGEIIVGIFTIIILWLDRFKLKKIDQYLFFFYFITVATSLLCISLPYFQLKAFITVIMRLIFYAVVINIARTHFDFMYIEKMYYTLIFIFSFYLIIQSFYHSFTGGYLPIYIKYEWQFPPESRPVSLSDYYKWNFRASSMFLEPSYFTLFVLPSLCPLLFKYKRTIFETITLIVAIIAVLLSSASSGFIGIIILFIVFLIKTKGNQKITHYRFSYGRFFNIFKFFGYV